MCNMHGWRQSDGLPRTVRLPNLCCLYVKISFSSLHIMPSCRVSFSRDCWNLCMRRWLSSSCSQGWCSWRHLLLSSCLSSTRTWRRVRSTPTSQVNDLRQFLLLRIAEAAENSWSGRLISAVSNCVSAALWTITSPRNASQTTPGHTLTA